MTRKFILIAAVALFCALGSAAASDTDSCHDLYDIYIGCYKQGESIQKIKCKALADELWKHFLDKTSNEKEEQISAVVADICEDGCLDAIEDGSPLPIHEFRNQYCK